MNKYCYYLVVYVLLVLPSTVVAQELKDFMRYEYVLTYKPFDKKAYPNAEPVVEKFYLDIDGRNSIFLTERSYLKYESFRNKEKKEIRRSLIPWIVARKKKNVILYEAVSTDSNYYVNQTNKIKWKIVKGKETYKGMKVRRAIGELSGRIWTVWFTKEIPIKEGPYKFKNLPGFVVKASDADQDYVFEFIESKKVRNYWFDLGIFNFFEETEEKDLKLFKKAISILDTGLYTMNKMMETALFKVQEHDSNQPELYEAINPLERYE